MLYLVMEWRLKNKSLGVFVLPVAFLIMAYASIAPGISNRIEPLIPALQSNWLTSHVLTCFMGYAAFTVAFALGIMFFIKKAAGADTPKAGVFIRLLPSESQMDELMYSSIALGFIFLTLGIITGSVWAHYAWGSYWSWDPEGNLVFDHLAGLCRDAARPPGARLARPAHGLHDHYRFRLRCVHLSGRESAAEPAQLHVLIRRPGS